MRPAHEHGQDDRGERPQARDEQRPARGDRHEDVVVGVGTDAAAPAAARGGPGPSLSSATRLGQDEPPAAERPEREAVPGTGGLPGERGPGPGEADDAERGREGRGRPQRPAPAQERGGGHGARGDEHGGARAAVVGEPRDEDGGDGEPASRGSAATATAATAPAAGAGTGGGDPSPATTAVTSAPAATPASRRARGRSRRRGVGSVADALERAPDDRPRLVAHAGQGEGERPRAARRACRAPPAAAGRRGRSPRRGRAGGRAAAGRAPAAARRPAGRSRRRPARGPG